MSTMIDYMQLCRLCLVKEKVNVPIFGDTTDVRQIYLKIAACLPVKVTQEDNLPKKICDACLYKVDLLYQFWNTSVNAEKQLIQWLTEIGVDVNIKNSDIATQPLPILPQSHAHPHSMPSETLMLKQERPDMIDGQPPVYPLQNQQGLYPAYDNLGYPQPEVSMEVGNAARFENSSEIAKIEEPVEEPPAPTPKKRGRPPAANKKTPPKRKAPEEVIPARTPATKRRSSAAAAAAAVAAAAAAASDSEDDSDIDDRLEGLGGDDDSDDDDDDGRVAKEEVDSDSDYVEPTAFVGVPSDPNQDGEQPGPSGLSGVPGKAGATGTNAATESGSPKKTAEFKCSTCPKTFAMKSKLFTHEIKHTSDRQYECKFCSKRFKYPTTLQQHEKWMHKSESCPKCAVCEKVFDTVSLLNKHLANFANITPSTCTVCQKSFHLQKELRCHEFATHNAIDYSCYNCKSIFTDAKELKQHIISEHPDHETTEHACDYCGKCFPHQRNKTKHISWTHVKSYKRVCEICGKHLTSYQSLKDHLVVHSGIKPINCEFCGKQFAKKTTLRIHIRTHTGEKSYKCPKCDKRFTQRSPLVLHIRKHDGIRPYQCEICLEGFVSKRELTYHKKSFHKIIDVNVEDLIHNV